VLQGAVMVPAHAFDWEVCELISVHMNPRAGVQFFSSMRFLAL
jgi:hypothetical protein